jgi:hypothetical protein
MRFEVAEAKAERMHDPLTEMLGFLHHIAWY